LGRPIHKITKVPVFSYMALGLNAFDGSKSITRAIGRVGPENLDFFGPSPSSGLQNGFAGIKIFVPYKEQVH
jgi:hypothetical protein